ncbi:MAG: hypothetical protein OXN27_25670 [Candidatus Poribacteria bacterium]|nr:hypothetical protein [Candidatus Poribacteria bacterium]
MRIRETNVDERLDLLENVDNGEVFLFDRKTSRTRFHNKTVAKLQQNKAATHALIVFEEAVPRPRAMRVAKQIGETLEAFNRAIEIDIFFEIPRELFDLIRAECN